MKNLSVAGITLLIVIVLSSACTSKADRTIAEVEVLLDSLQSLLAPDTRVELWKLSVINIDGEIFLEGEVAGKKIYNSIVSSVEASFPGVNRQRLQLLPQEGSERVVNGLVNNSLSHLRREPSSKTELLTQALLGTPVRILKEVEGKRFIQLPDGYLGWVNVNEVHFLEPEDLASYRDAQKIIFSSQSGFAYSEPIETSVPVADLVAGCILPVVLEKGRFYQVEYPDGRLAWVKKGEVVAAEDVFHKEAVKEELVLSALAFHGIPYLWGGASSKMLDCSGFVSNVFFMNGIQMPRDADQQALCGREISTEFDAAGLERGDLLFFGRKASKVHKERVNHVAIYIGEGEFVHAAGYRDRVSINSMDSTQTHFIESYPEIFVRSSRIIGEEPNGFLPIERNQYYKEIIK